jgi:hypothetical protein
MLSFEPRKWCGFCDQDQGVEDCAASAAFRRLEALTGGCWNSQGGKSDKKLMQAKS